MDDPHYACAPLHEWLPRLAGRGAAVHVVDTLPRSLRPLLAPLPALGPAIDSEDAASDLIVVVGEAPPAEVAGIAARVAPGGWLVELVPVSRGLARTLLALRPDGLYRVALGRRSAARWSTAGLCALQQWASVDPPDLLVTLGRRRASQRVAEPD